MAKKEYVIDCDWCGKGIKDTKRDPICVSRDGKDTICITCSEQPASDEQAGEPVTKVRYIGQNAGKRAYDVAGQVVTEVDEEAWEYACSCGFVPRDDEQELQDPTPCAPTNVCAHVLAVMEARDEFEKADAKMGDPNP